MESTQRRWQSAQKPTEEQVHEQLSRILASGELQLPRRATALLEFVVMETIAGRGDYLKGFTIATSVFGRDANFDPQNDPCVRIEAARVRRALERYYLVCGSGDAVEITIPKGGYRPVFKLRVSSQVTEELASPTKASGMPVLDAKSFWLRRIPDVFDRSDKRARNMALLVGAVCPASILVIAVLLEASTASQGSQEPYLAPHIIVGSFSGDAALQQEIADPRLGIVFRDEMISSLISHPELTVLVKDSATEASSERRYIVDGAVSQENGRFRISARLIRASDGVVVWAGSRYHTSVTLGQAAEDSSADFASEISGTLQRKS